VRLPLPHLFQIGVDTTIKAPLYVDGSLVAPDAASTVQIISPDGTDLVAATTVTVTGSIAEYTLSAASSAALSPEEGYQVEWVLLVSTVQVARARTDAATVRRLLPPVITDVDIIRRVRALDTSLAGTITTMGDFQDPLDEGWTQIQARLYAQGNRPNLIMSPSSLRAVHLALTLAIIFEDLAARLNAYEDRAAAFRREFLDEWNALVFLYDAGDDGQPDDKHRRRAAAPSLWLGVGPSSGGRWREPKT
jgi:hypothetical protein